MTSRETDPSAAPTEAHRPPPGEAGFDPGVYWEGRHRAYGGEDLRSTGHKLFTSAANEQQITEKVALLVCLIQAMGLPRDASLLDAGCGQGFTTRYLEQAGFDCFGVDVSPTAIETARQAGAGEYAVAALHEMQLGRCFDIVLCTDVLYHMVEDGLWERALGALADHLDDDGVLLVVEAFSDVPSAIPHVRWRTLPLYSEAFERLDLCIAASEVFTESVTGHTKTILIVCQKGREDRYAEAVRGARIEVLRAAFGRRTAHQEAKAAALAAAAEAQRAGQARLDEARATIVFFKAEVRKAGVRTEQSKANAAAAERRLEALRRSQSYRLGDALVRAAKLPAALLRGRARPGTSIVKADEDAPVPFAARIEAVAARDDVARAEVLLYAYIDLNLAGGSSIWLSSMASMLARHRRVILLARRNITTDVVVAAIENQARVTILEPRHFDHRLTHFKMKEAIEIVRGLDAACPGLTAIFIRGTDAASMLLADSQFHARAYAYLTDFYEIGEDGVRVSAERTRQLGVIATHARRILVQTDRIAERIREVTGKDFPSLELPPPIADDLPIQARRPASPTAARRRIRIGYAGKIAPDWGIRELLDWTEMLRADGLDVELTIIGSKISGPTESIDAFRYGIIRRMGEVGAIRHEQVTRAEAIARMRDMDFAWCWRPASLEQATLELSTKLVEGVASGFACICFPSETNRRLLGENYPYFAKTLEDLWRLLGKEAVAVPAATVAACRERHSFATLAARLDATLPSPDRRPAPRICFAGHDFRFIDPYISRLKLDGWPVTRDVWQWGDPEDLALSRARLAAADIVFCEWGQANAVWYSRNLPPEKRLFVRIHLPEIGERARHLAEEILPDAVERFIFVSARVRDEAVRLYGWPPERTVVIPNFVLDDEYALQERSFAGPIRLGMVGIVPWCKRIDRAIDLLEALHGAGHAAELHIKGPRPETIGFMHSKDRREELVRYDAQYDRLRRNPDLDRAVTFHPEENDDAAFYRIVDHILSPSEIESFHHAVADGVLSGCHPVLWPWEGAAATYDPDWIVGSTAAAMDRILAFRRQSPPDRSKALARNRALVCNGYGKEPVFARLTGMLIEGTVPRKTKQSWRDRLPTRMGLTHRGRSQFEIASRTPKSATFRDTSMISHNVPLHIALKYILEYRKFQSKHQDVREPAVLCPCCGSTFAEWAPIRGEGRKTECPICRSYERHRHLWLTIHQDSTFFDKGSRLLHFAPEPFFREVFGNHPNIDYHDCDIAQSRATYQVDITKIPFEDERFDRIICSHVLEHVPDDRKGISELRRTLRAGGIAYILVPSEVRESTFEEDWINTPTLRLKHYRQATHVRIYSRDDFIERLRDMGFDVTVQFPKRRFGESMCAEFGLGDNIYICRKNY